MNPLTALARRLRAMVGPRPILRVANTATAAADVAAVAAATSANGGPGGTRSPGGAGGAAPRASGAGPALRRRAGAANAAPITPHLVNALAPDGDGWIAPVWVGEFPHPMGLQKVEPADLDLILANIATVRAAEGEAWPGIPFYLGHPADMTGAPAYAWAKDIRVRDGRLELRPEWSGQARELLANKAYKFTSVCWPCTRADDGSLHPFYVEHVGLTNVPNIGGQTPLVNSAGAPPPEPPPGRLVSPDPSVAIAPQTRQSPAAALPPSTLRIPMPPVQPAANAAPEGTPWWLAFTGRLAEMVSGAGSAAEAQRLLQDKLDALFAAMRQHEELQDLIGRIAKALGLEPVPATAGSVLVDAVNALAQNAAEAATLREAYHVFLVEQAIARGAVAPALRTQALALAAANAGAARALWFGAAPALPSDGRGPGRAEAPAPSRSAAVLPSSPLAGVALATGVPAPRPAANARAAGADGGEAAARIVNAARRIQAQSGCDWSTAHDRAYTAWEAGRLDLELATLNQKA